MAADMHQNLYRRVAALLFLLLWAGNLNASEQRTDQDYELRAVIEAIEQNTSYRFLYRDALVADRKLSISQARSLSEISPDELIEHLLQQSVQMGVSVRVDEERRQIFLFGMDPEPSDRQIASISGRILDARTGAGLAYATVSWEEEDRMKGVVSDASGHFIIPLDRLPQEEEVSLQISSLGYRRVAISSAAARQQPLVIRLEAAALPGVPLIVAGKPGSTPADTLWLNHLHTNVSASENSVRRLAHLPSVGLMPAFSGGTHVRGSPPDAFRLMLDNVSVYNQHHFFGLFDAFNIDALQAVGFYYTITPAYYEGTPGGSLRYHTRSGSKSSTQGEAGISNTVARMTFGGPVHSGRGSWLISGRYALLELFDFPGNEELLQWGLDINRPNSGIVDEQALGNGPGRSIVNEHGGFYDLHAKGVYDAGKGRDISLNAYIGGSHAWVDTERLLPDRSGGRPFLRRAIARTEHQWGNEALSLRLKQPLNNMHLTATAGYSRSESSYRKDDFVYARNTSGNNDVEYFISPFINNNTLHEFSLMQRVDMASRAGGLLTAGHHWKQLKIKYFEENVYQPEYSQRQLGWQWSPFLHLSQPIGSDLSAEAGIRGHYYSNGGYYRLSPRLELRYEPVSVFGLTAGYSRNYQFLHSLSLRNYSSGNYWILSNQNDGPSEQDYITTGIWLRPDASHAIQLDAYYKLQRKLRLSKINARMLASRPDFEQIPWLAANRLKVSGLEMRYENRSFNSIRLTTSWAWTHARTRNPDINDGNWYDAEWNRRHKLQLFLSYALSDGFSIRLQSMWANGTFNTMSLVRDTEPEYLGSYRRTDASIHYKKKLARSRSLEAGISFFNLFDQNNPLYRTSLLTAGQVGSENRLNQTMEDVYDLGLTPSFDISYQF